MIAKGDKIYVTAAYADGAVSYASQLGNATGRVKEVALNGTVGSDFVDDGIAIRKTKTWSVNGGFHHEFNPKWEFNFDAGYVNVDGFGTRDYSFVGVGGDIRWKPVSNMYIALDAEYGSLSYSTGTQALRRRPTTAGPRWSASAATSDPILRSEADDEPASRRARFFVRHLGHDSIRGTLGRLRRSGAEPLFLFGRLGRASLSDDLDAERRGGWFIDLDAVSRSWSGANVPPGSRMTSKRFA